MSELDFTWNIANQAARTFYERAGGKILEPAAELQVKPSRKNNLDSQALHRPKGLQQNQPNCKVDFDAAPNLKDRVVMTTRHCLRYELGWCPVHPNPEPWKRLPEPKGPLFLENGPTRLECRFDCDLCRMELVLRS